MNVKLKPLLTLVLGLITGALGFYLISTFLLNSEWWPGHTTHNHSSEEYHIHADFLIVVKDEIIDLSSNEYMTTATQTLHQHVHLHDNDDNVLHVHKEDIGFAEFLTSLNIVVTDDCLTLPTGAVYCGNETNQLVLYVNNVKFIGPINSYIPKDVDQILLYFGEKSDSAPATFTSQITTNACVFSGSCPERGLPPPESCGLTCEL